MKQNRLYSKSIIAVGMIALLAIASCRKETETPQIKGPVEFFGITGTTSLYTAKMHVQLGLSTRGYYVPLRETEDDADRDIVSFSFRDTIAGDSTNIVYHTETIYDGEGEASHKASLVKYIYLRPSGFDSTEMAKLHRLYDGRMHYSFDAASLKYEPSK